jgi:hypothetical protein
MMNVLSKIVFILTICVAIGCTTSNNKPVVIDFSADSSMIVVTGINPVGLLQLKNSETGETTSGQWVLVTADGEKISGKVQIESDTLVFIPVTAFVKGKTYLVSTPLNSSFGNGKAVLQGEVNYRMAPQQKLLQR